jgi:hypothetical protein
VAIYKLLADAAYEPDRVRLMVEAYECACRELELAGNKTDIITEIVAKKIVEIAQAEIDADAQVICDRSLEELGITRH